MSTKNETDNEICVYEFLTKSKELVTITIEDVTENPKFFIKGPKALISKVIGGIGDEDETEAWVTEKELKGETVRTFAILELMKLIHG